MQDKMLEYDRVEGHRHISELFEEIVPTGTRMDCTKPLETSVKTSNIQSFMTVSISEVTQIMEE
jgi:hypothetical protein